MQRHDVNHHHNYTNVHKRNRFVPSTGLVHCQPARCHHHRWSLLCQDYRLQAPWEKRPWWPHYTSYNIPESRNPQRGRLEATFSQPCWIMHRVLTLVHSEISMDTIHSVSCHTRQTHPTTGETFLCQVLFRCLATKHHLLECDTHCLLSLFGDRIFSKSVAASFPQGLLKKVCCLDKEQTASMALVPAAQWNWFDKLN